MPTPTRSNTRVRNSKTSVSSEREALQAFFRSSWGRFCLWLGAGALLLLLDLLLSGNRLSTFCIWVGMETLLGFILYWATSNLLRGDRDRRI